MPALVSFQPPSPPLSPRRSSKLLRNRNYSIYNKRRQSIEVSTFLIMAQPLDPVAHSGPLLLPFRLDSLQPGAYHAELRAANLHLRREGEEGEHEHGVLVLDLGKRGWASARRWGAGDGQAGRGKEGWKALGLSYASPATSRASSAQPSILSSARNSILLRKSSSPGLIQLTDSTNLDHSTASAPPPATAAPAGEKDKTKRKLTDRFRSKRGKSISTVAAILEDSTPPPPLPTSASFCVSSSSTPPLSSCPSTPGPPSLILLAPDLAACEGWVNALNAALVASAPPSAVPTRHASLIKSERPGMVASGSLPAGLGLSASGTVDRSFTDKLLGRRPGTSAGLTTELPAGFNPDRRPSWLDRPPPSPGSYGRSVLATNGLVGAPGPLSAPVDGPVVNGQSTATLVPAEATESKLQRRGSTGSKGSSPDLRGRRSFTFGARSPEPSTSSSTGAAPMAIPMERAKSGGRSSLGSDASASSGHKFFGLLGKKSKKDTSADVLSSSASTTGSFEVVRRAAAAQWDLAGAAQGSSSNGNGTVKTAPNGLPYARPSEDTSCSGDSADTDSLFSGSLHTSESSAAPSQLVRPATPTLAEMGVGLEAAWPAERAEEEGGKTPKATKESFAREAVRRRETFEAHRMRMPTIESVDGGLDQQEDWSGLRRGEGGGEGRTPTRRGSERSTQSGSTRRSVSTGRMGSRRATTDEDDMSEVLSQESLPAQQEQPRLYERRGVLGGRRTVSISASKAPAPKSLSTPPAVPYSPFASSIAGAPSPRAGSTPSPGMTRRHTHQPHQAFLSPQPSPYGSEQGSLKSPALNGGGGGSGRPVSMAPPARPVTPGVVEHIVAPVQLIEQMREEHRVRSLEKARRAGAGLSPPPMMRSASAGIPGRGANGLPVSPSFASAMTDGAEGPASALMRKTSSAPLQPQPLGLDAPRRGSFGLQSCGPLVMDPAEDDVRNFTLEEMSAVGQVGAGSDSEGEGERSREWAVGEGRRVEVC